MPRFDQDRLIKLVSQMRDAAVQLERLKKSKREVFLSDTDKLGSAKYHFIVAMKNRSTRYSNRAWAILRSSLIK